MLILWGCYDLAPGSAKGQGGIRRERVSVVAPEAGREVVGGGCQSGGGWLLSVTNAIEAGTWREGDSGWAWAGRPWGEGGGATSPPSNASLPRGGGSNSFP